nr:cadherin-like and PC-esterase domain-containing protein 1 [Chrysemys picta bellii]XP_042699857.1 cadherin-like and PC-esterase domain-containing protein 1 [Chrysemys picta bellii]XP_042699859.1 cadherin-like and PC-esterase domain-containing protein 1 [Chrysemys picta bellii]
MVCWQIPSCRRLCRPRPFLLVLVVGVYLFYQILPPIRTKRFFLAVDNGSSPNKLAAIQQERYKEVSSRNTHCFFPSNNSQTVNKIEDSILKYFGSHTRRAILYVPPSRGKKELQLYQRILAQYGYTVTVLEDRKLIVGLGHEHHYQGKLSSWDLLICLSSSKTDDTDCFPIDDFHQLELFQKVNTLPEIQHLLCRKEGLCQIIRAFPGCTVGSYKIMDLCFRTVDLFIELHCRSHLRGMGLFSLMSTTYPQSIFIPSNSVPHGLCNHHYFLIFCT